MEMLGYVHTLSGSTSEGLELLQEALSAGEVIGFKMYLTPTVIHLGKAPDFSQIRPRKRKALAGRGLGLVREHGQRSQEAWSLRLFGEIETRDLSNLDRAAAYYRQYRGLWACGG